ncbi:MAG: hypothetical protein LBT25_11505 [Candidatus Symbiothrix sp.]|jgi:hypothetical protein|nr:hypothetical protein [Candidatus Symbiothrix sp.]
MKRNFILRGFMVVALCLSFSFGTYAQDVFKKGDKVVNLGIGLGTYGGYSGFSSSFLPISGSFEYGILDNLINGKAGIGVGGYLAYTSWKNKATDWTASDFIIGARGSFHYQFVDKLDTYVGLMLGYDIYNSSYSGSDGSSSVSFSTFLGARYYLTDNIGVFAELGYGVAALELGVAYKF